MRTENRDFDRPCSVFMRQLNRSFFCRYFVRFAVCLIPICRSAVKPSGFLIMARLTQALPITLIPEQLLITSVRDHMVNHLGLNILSVPHTLLAQRMLSKICLACLLPTAAVAALACRTCVFRMLPLMFGAVFLSVFHELSAARMPARRIRSFRHDVFLQ